MKQACVRALIHPLNKSAVLFPIFELVKALVGALTRCLCVWCALEYCKNDVNPIKDIDTLLQLLALHTSCLLKMLYVRLRTLTRHSEVVSDNVLIKMKIARVRALVHVTCATRAIDIFVEMNYARLRGITKLEKSTQNACFFIYLEVYHENPNHHLH